MMLHTKYLSCGSCGFREGDFSMFSLYILGETKFNLGRDHFNSGDHDYSNLG